MKKDYWTIIISAIFFGLIIPGGQFFSNLGFSLYEISAYSLLFLFVFTLPIIVIKKTVPIRRDNLLFFVLYGLIGALLQLTQYGGVIFGTLFVRILLNEKMTKMKLLSVTVAFLGVVFLLSPWNISNVGSTKGLISSLLAGIFLSLWVIFARKTGINKDYYINTLSAYSFVSLIWLILLFPAIKFLYQNEYLTRLSYNFPTSYWAYFGLFCLIAAFLPNSLFYKAIEKVEASKAGIILLLEPVVASIVAMIVFSQYLNSSIFVGGGLILISNYLAIKE